MADWIPDSKPGWWGDLEQLMTQIQTYGIVGWFRRNLVRFLVGALAGFVLDIAGIIRSAWNAVNGAYRDAGETVAGAIGVVGDEVIQPLGMMNSMMLEIALGDSLGPFEAPIIVALYLVELAIVLRLAKPLLLAIGEAASGIPVIGGVINSGVTFGVRASESLWGFGRRLAGGLT